MNAESIRDKIAELTKYLEQLCALAMNETDRAKQTEISAEIDRVVEEKRELEESVKTS